jgi:hypothetical protein
MPDQDWFAQFAAAPEGDDFFAQFAEAPAKRATPPPRSATIGMLAPDTMTAPPAAGMTDEQWAGLSAGEKLRNVLQWGGKAIASMTGMNEAGREAFENPGTTLALAAVPLLPKVPGVLARGLGISQARAGANIQAAAQAAEGAPVGVEGVGREGLRALELQASGGSMPRAASQLMRRITDPGAGDLTFEEARDFYSNLSRLSANEFGRLNPTMQRQIGAMRQALHEALVESAGTVGEGERYASGVREYARAGKAADYGKRAAKAAGIGLSADYILRRISNAISGSATGGR